LLVLSVIPYGINLLYLGRARVRVSAPRIVAVQAVIAGLILGLSLILVPLMGVDGVGVAYLVGQGTVAVVLLATVLRPLLTTTPGVSAGEGPG
jgi:Na+-driven multidrug efflux pump